MDKKPNGYIRVSKSHRFTQPFNITIMSHEGEMLSSTETLTTHANVHKNILAQMKVFNSTMVEVRDTITNKHYTLFPDGTETDHHDNS